MPDLDFDLVSAPSVTEIAPFRFAHVRTRGPYVPWARVQALDTVAETLERLGIERVGPAFGVYHDMPFSVREGDAWIADLGYPIADGASVPASAPVRVRDLPPAAAVGLRYRGDLGSFPVALQFLLEWAAQRGIDLAGCLLERFYVSNALTGEEERDVYVTLHSVAP